MVAESQDIKPWSNEPIAFPVKAQLPGVKEGLQLAERRLTAGEGGEAVFLVFCPRRRKKFLGIWEGGAIVRRLMLESCLPPRPRFFIPRQR